MGSAEFVTVKCTISAVIEGKKWDISLVCDDDPRGDVVKKQIIEQLTSWPTVLTELKVDG